MIYLYHALTYISKEIFSTTTTLLKHTCVKIIISFVYLKHHYSNFSESQFKIFSETLAFYSSKTTFKLNTAISFKK